MKKYAFFLLLVVLLAVQSVYAQENKTFTIEGKVVLKKNNEPIPYAQVVIKEISQWGFTNDNGEFKISGVLEGNYTLQAFALGYVNYELPIVVTKDIKSYVVKMLEDNLTLNEVVVTAKQGERMNSSSKIDKTAIEHLQASSVADVMQLLPGAVIKNPSLTGKNNIAIRGFTEGSNVKDNYRGTAFIVNGGQINNDANIYSSYSGASSVPTTDYRAYSTENIESVEVIKGVVSAEYGDMTSGAVIVTTKAGRTPYEFRVKADPMTKAFSANKGFGLGNDNGYINIDGDYARAASDLRSPVNTFDRVNFGVTYSNTFNNNRKPFRLNARITGGFITNSEKSDPDVGKIDFTKNKSREFTASLYGNWSLNKSWISSLTYNINGRYGVSNYREYKAVSGVALPTTNIMSEGIALGYFTSASYNEDMRVNEVPLYLNAKISGNLNKKLGKTLSKTVLGFEWNSKGNNGDGIYYIGEKPQYFRERKYSDIPFMHTFSAFLEEKLTIPFGKTSLETSLGARLTKLIIDNYDYDPTIDPRFNVKYNFVKNSRNTLIKDFAIRGGWGILQRLPSLNMLYSGDEYTDRALFQYRNPDNNEYIALIQTKIDGEIHDYNLAPTKTTNMEVGFDLNIGGVKMSVSYFNENLKNGISDDVSYIPESVKYYNSISSLTASPKYEDGKIMIKDDSGNYVENGYNEVTEYWRISRPDVRGKQKKWGIEYDINFGRIKSINTAIILNGAYIFNKNYMSGFAYDYIGGQDPINTNQRFPYVSIFSGDIGISNGSNKDRFVTNINFITNVPKYRLVVSLTTQCVWMDRSWSTFNTGELYEFDANGKKVYGAYNKEHSNATIYRDPLYYIDNLGNVKSFNDCYSTSDSNLRRRLEMMRISSNRPYTFLKNSYKPYFMASIRVTKEISNFASLSFYANNFTNSNPLMVNSARPNSSGIRKNSDIYFGAELRIKL
jgi:Outer membrane cobalamin receptor protein